MSMISRKIYDVTIDAAECAAYALNRTYGTRPVIHLDSVMEQVREMWDSNRTQEDIYWLCEEVMDDQYTRAQLLEEIEYAVEALAAGSGLSTPRADWMRIDRARYDASVARRKMTAARA